MDEMDEMSSSFTIDSLPFDCLVCICEYLAPSDLCRFGGTCKLFYEASLVGYLWRQHSLNRWTFCDIFQIPDGPQRWRRYFLARRRVDASLDKGRPIRDYKVKTLRGHKTAIKTALVVGGGDVDWEDVQPPLVISLSVDHCVKAWDLTQGTEVWSSDGKVASIAVDTDSGELATGKVDGSVSLWDTKIWKERCHLIPITTQDPAAVEFVRYGNVKKSPLPKKGFLMVLCHVRDSEEQLEMWDTSSSSDVAMTTSPHSLLALRTPHHHQERLQLCQHSSLLAIPSRLGDVHIWDLSSVSLPPPPPQATPLQPLPPHVTIPTNTSPKICWVSPGVLATYSEPFSLQIKLWAVSSHLLKSKQIRRLRDDNNTILDNTLRAIMCQTTPTSLSVGNGMMVVGGEDGSICLFDGSLQEAGKGECLQVFRDHVGPVTDLYVDRHRVLSCSKDFSIRVYRWSSRDQQGQQQQQESSSRDQQGQQQQQESSSRDQQGQQQQQESSSRDQQGQQQQQESSSKDRKMSPIRLESRYTLLGGSVAHKTHDGFSKVLCEAASCIGIAGDQLKFYNFSCKLENQ